MIYCSFFFFIRLNFDFRQGGLNFRKWDLDLLQVGLDVRQGGFDFRQDGLDFQLSENNKICLMRPLTKDQSSIDTLSYPLKETVITVPDLMAISAHCPNIECIAFSNFHVVANADR